MCSAFPPNLLHFLELSACLSVWLCPYAWTGSLDIWCASRTYVGKYKCQTRVKKYSADRVRMLFKIGHSGPINLLYLDSLWACLSVWLCPYAWTDILQIWCASRTYVGKYKYRTRSKKYLADQCPFLFKICRAGPYNIPHFLELSAWLSVWLCPYAWTDSLQIWCASRAYVGKYKCETRFKKYSADRCRVLFRMCRSGPINLLNLDSLWACLSVKFGVLAEHMLVNTNIEPDLRNT